MKQETDCGGESIFLSIFLDWSKAEGPKMPCLIVRLASWVAGWLGGWVAGWLGGCLAVWLASRLAAWLAAC